MTGGKKLLIVGNRGGSNVGESFARACGRLNIAFTQIEVHGAMRGPAIIRRLLWRFWDHRPIRLNGFSQEIVDLCRQERPAMLLSLGISPITGKALSAIGKLGCYRANFLTDDPWSSHQYSAWFQSALPHYDLVATPRSANMGDLKRVGVRRMLYLPFAWDPALCNLPSFTDEELAPFRSDVAFAGGADADRAPFFAALDRAGIRVALYGSYWERYRDTRNLGRGQLPIELLPKAIAGAKVALCLVRQANRDGHCMRTFEVPALGACMLTQDTGEHREILGPDGECVVYFQGMDDMVQKAKWLIDNPDVRQRLASNAAARIRTYRHTYAHRLEELIRTSGLDLSTFKTFAP